METSLPRDLLTRIRQLDAKARSELMTWLRRLVAVEPTSKNPTNRLSDLDGLGAEIWKDVDTEKYIQEQRDWD